LESGAAHVDSQGRIVANVGKAFSDGLSFLGAGDMASTKQIIAGNQRFNIDRDSATGKTLVNVDSSENIKRGRDSHYGLTGYVEHALGTAGEVGMFTLAGLGLGEGVARKMGMKDGIAKPLWNKLSSKYRGLFGGQSVHNPQGNTPHNSSQGNNSVRSHGPQGQQNQSVHGGTSFQSNSTPNSSTKSALLQEVEAKRNYLDKQGMQGVKNGGISPDEYADKNIELDNLQEKIKNGNVRVNDLKNNGISSKGLHIGDKGVIDFDKTDESENIINLH